MKPHVVEAILRKDLAAFGRDRFFVLITALGVVLYPLLFWLLPGSVDETLRIGVTPARYAESLGAAQGQAADEADRQASGPAGDAAGQAGGPAGDAAGQAGGPAGDAAVQASGPAGDAAGQAGGPADDAGGQDQGAGLLLVPYDDATDLARAVETGQDGLLAGIALPTGFADAVAAGEPTTVRLLLDAEVPPQVETMLSGLVAELAYAAAGQAPPVSPATEAVVLGEDRVGDQVALREQLRPLLAFFVLLVETLALASLVASEVQQRTVTAVLVTPATVTEFIAAKGILGTGMAFVEAALIMALIGGLTTQPVLLLLALLLGAALVTGFGLVAGAYGRDFIAVLFLSMMFMIPLMIPAFAALFPGSAAVWVRALPSFPLVETIVQVTTQGAGWADVGGHLAALLAWCVAAFALGVLVLRRKVVRL